MPRYCFDLQNADNYRVMRLAYSVSSGWLLALNKCPQGAQSLFRAGKGTSWQ